MVERQVGMVERQHIAAIEAAKAIVCGKEGNEDLVLSAMTFLQTLFAYYTKLIKEEAANG